MHSWEENTIRNYLSKWNNDKTIFILKVSIVCILVILIGTSNIYAHTDNIQFKNMTTNDGLSQASGEAIFQDSKGYIWIGTSDGLNRYNGYDFKIYKYKKGSKESIASNYIFSIDEDKDGNIWVGTISGVSKISSDGNKVTNYYDEKDNGNLSSNNAADILITKDNVILVGTENGVNIYDEKSDSFSRILESEDSLTSQDIYSIDEDENGDIWVGTYDGLNKIDIKSKKIKHFYTDDTETSISENSIYKVYCDQNGYTWVGTESKGLNKININTNEITRYNPDEGEKFALQGGFVTNILRDRSGTIWVCTDNGLSMYNEKNDRFETHQNKLYDAYSLINNMTLSIIQDKTGLIWVGTYSGISVFNPENKVELYNSILDNKKSLNDNVIHGLYEGSNGYIWAGTKSNGVNVLKRYPNKDKHSEVIHVLSKDNGLSDNSINHILGDKHYIWIATRNGLNKVNKKTGDIKIYNVSDGMVNNNIKTLMLDSKGYLWIGTPSGVNILDTRNDELIDITYILKNNGITDLYIQSIYEDNDGYIFLGTFKEGQTLIVDAKTKNINLFSERDNEGQNSIYAFAEDDKYIWIGTSYGLNRVDKGTKKYKKYTEEDGLCNNNVYSIIIDDEDKIWVSTNDGISVLNPETEVFTNYNITDGLQSNEFNAGSYYKCKDGSIMFGGINGFNIFNPKDMQKDNLGQKAVFEKFIVNDKVYSNIDNIKIQYGSNLSIKFFFPDYSDVKNTQFYYKMSGIDNEWSLAESNKIIYRNLYSGMYTFKIKAIDHNGIESEETSVKFVVKPHILFSPLAYISYACAIVVIIYMNRMKVKNLDRLVKNRTLELNNEMNKNKELYEKVIELEKNKNNYFVNLSHELRTPLNVISSTQQLLIEFNKNGKKISEEKLEYHLNVMKNNTKRLLNLINNIIDAAKVEHGNYHLSLETQDIVYIVEETALDMRDYIEASGIKLIIDPEVEEKNIECDRKEIERCIVNLIDNARRFTPMDGLIEVKIIDLNDKVKITVRDTGSGIDKENQKHIFDRFNQVVDENSERKGGSGLGLTITKHIIDMHNGEIYVESELTKGSTFTIILPVKVK